MELTYFKDTDTMRITFRGDLEGYDSEEISPGIVADFAENGELVGMEIYDAASSKFDLSNLVLMRREKDGIDARFDIGTGFLLRDSGEARSA
ncbi:MAG: DUF2283 domain-containing protein [Rubrobacteraceae bacterium]